MIAGVPTIMQDAKVELEKNPQKYQSLKGRLDRAICGGGAPPPVLMDWYYKNWGIEIIQAWGMTEMNPLGSLGAREVRRDDIGASNEQKLGNQIVQGVIVPCVEAKVCDSDNLDKELAIF